MREEHPPAFSYYFIGGIKDRFIQSFREFADLKDYAYKAPDLELCSKIKVGYSLSFQSCCIKAYLPKYRLGSGNFHISSTLRLPPPGPARVCAQTKPPSIINLLLGSKLDQRKISFLVNFY